MAALSNRICSIPGVMGAAILDRDGSLLEHTELSDSVRSLLDELTPLLLPVITHCLNYDPEIQHLSLRFQEMSVFLKVYARGFVIVLCRNDVVVYWLDASIEAMFKEAQEPELT